MGKRVKVTTRCGEEYVYQYEQEVETVEIVEAKFTQVKRVGSCVWSVNLEKGYYLEEDDNAGYYAIVDAKGNVVGRVYKGELTGDTRLV